MIKEENIREGDIIEIDYIEEFTKERVNEGKALVIWKGFNGQPLVRKLDTKTTVWDCYEHISKVVGHIDFEEYMDNALEQQPCENKIIDEHYKKGFAAGIRTAEWRHNNAIAEIRENADRLKDSLYGDGLRHALEILDEYREGNEEEE